MATGAASLWMRAGNGWLFRSLDAVRDLASSIGEEASGLRVPLADLLGSSSGTSQSDT
jgi:hypothetical protein